MGLTPASPGFGTVQISPRLDLAHGPRSLKGVYSSVHGVISSSWKVGNGTVSLAVTLPIGVQAADIVVPKPFTAVTTPPPPARQLCGSASEGGARSSLTLSCDEGSDGSVVDKVEWAAWGTPELSGPCAGWTVNATCNDNSTGVDSPMAIVTANCMGRPSCTIVFGGAGSSQLGDPCPTVIKTLAARVHCSTGKGGIVWKPAAIATVTEGGRPVWDGEKLVGAPVGVVSARDAVNGVAFSVFGNSAWEFVSHKK